MVRKSSYDKTLEVFFKEPTKLHFVKEISRKTKIAHTSIRRNIDLLLKENLIIRRESNPFSGYIANRENPHFLFQKRLYNISTLENLKNFVEKNIFPKLLLVFGSYSLGEDIESSDIDLIMISKTKKINLSKFENELQREINLIQIENINKLDKPLIKKAYNGFVLIGGFDE